MGPVAQWQEHMTRIMKVLVFKSQPVQQYKFIFSARITSVGNIDAKSVYLAPILVKDLDVLVFVGG